MTAPLWRALIVDDEPPARRTLHVLLAGYPTVHIAGECGDAEAALRALVSLSPDIVFLDVQMPGATGIDIVRRAGVGLVPAVVFTTAYADHAVSAFEVQALDYLLKPFSDDRFHEVMARVLRTLDHTRPAAAPPPSPRALVIKDAGKTIVLPVQEIDWIEAEDYCARIHAGARHLLVRRSIRSLHTELGQDDFVRAHRSAVVNVGRIREVQAGDSGEGIVLLANGTTIRLSRTCRAEVRRRLTSRGEDAASRSPR